MTQEDKELLLKDLCARLPYGVIVQYPNIFRPSEIIKRRLEEISYSLIGINKYKININNDGIDIEYVKHYLRPLYSMTMEERTEYKQKQTNYEFGYFDTHASIDWLNAHHFDYRHLIGKGLALEAPKEMYKT